MAILGQSVWQDIKRPEATGRTRKVSMELLIISRGAVAVTLAPADGIIM